MPTRHSHFRLVVANCVLMLTVAILCGVLFWKPDTTSPEAIPGRITAESVPVNATPEPRKAVAATPQQITQSRREIAQEETATIALFKASSPSVVHITTHSVARDYFSLNVQKIPRGSGTGFVWDNQGHIVTNFHVLQGADYAHVAFGDQDNSPARLVGAAPEKDLAVLKIDADPSKLHPLPVGTSNDLEVGLKALAIGNPFGLDHTLTTGIISALGREIESPTGLPIKDVIQTDAAINPGNSGGPLLDSSGKLIGVNTAIYSPSGTYAGIGFAIPVDVVRWVVPELIKHGKVIRAGLAASLAPDRMIAQLGLPGVLIIDVQPGSQAELAKLQPTRRTRLGQIVLGDIITAINGTAVHDNKELLLSLENYKVGDKVSLTLWRDGTDATVEVELEVAN